MKAYVLKKRYIGTPLTKRETECAVLLLKGKTSKDVAKRLGISTYTVNFHVENLRAKLGCRTTFDLLKKLAKSELIKIQTSEQ